MKKYIVFVLICALLCGCSKKTTLEKPCNLYYVREEFTIGKADSVICPQFFEAKGLNLEELLSIYLKGPRESGLVSPFPAGTDVVSLSMSDQSISIVLNDTFASLSGIELSLACICLSKTCFDFTQVATVKIQCHTLKINGNEYVTVERQDAAMVDSYFPTSFPAAT